MSRFDWRIVPQSAWKNVYDFRDEFEGKTHECCGPVDNETWIDHIGVRQPKTVWAAPHAVDRLLELAAKHRLEKRRPKATVVFLGTEYPISVAFGSNHSERMATVRSLQKYFKRILYQTMDIRLPGVQIAPMGLSWGYTMALFWQWLTHRVNMTEAYTELAYLVSGNLSRKTRGALATCGVVANWLDANLTMWGVNIYKYFGMLFPPSNSSLRAVSAAYESRLRLRNWLGVSEGNMTVTSPAARAVGAEYRIMDMMMCGES